MRTESSAELATAVEVGREPARYDVARGVCLGIALAAAFAHVLFLWDADAVRGIYRDLTVEIPASARITTSLPWIAGVPVASVIAVALLGMLRPRSLAPYVANAAVFVAALLASWHFPTAALHEFADKIK